MKIPDSTTSLITIALRAAGALHDHEESIGILHNTETAVRGDVAAFTSAVDGFGDAKFTKSDSFIAQALAFSTAGQFLSAAVDVLTAHMGRNFSPAWAAAFGPSLAIPPTLAGRLEALRKIEKHLRSNPEREKPDKDATKAVTAARAKSVREALAGAISTVDRCKSDTRDKKGARARAKQALKKRLRGLVNELGQLISEDDPRWSAFGFNAPADTQVPEAVQGLVLEGFGPGRVGGEWGESSRAERYWVEIFVIGQDQQFRRVATVQDSDVELSLPPGAQVKVRIIAVNEAGPSAPSAEVEITVPLAEAA